MNFFCASVALVLVLVCVSPEAATAATAATIDVTYIWNCPPTEETHSWNESSCWQRASGPDVDLDNSQLYPASPNAAAYVAVPGVNLTIEEVLNIGYLFVGPESSVVMRASVKVTDHLRVQGVLGIASSNRNISFYQLALSNCDPNVESFIATLTFLGEDNVFIFKNHKLVIKNLRNALSNERAAGASLLNLGFYSYNDCNNQLKRWTTITGEAIIRITARGSFFAQVLEVSGSLNITSYGNLFIESQMDVLPGGKVTHMTGGIYAVSAAISTSSFSFETYFAVINVKPNATLVFDVKTGLQVTFNNMWLVNEGLVTVTGGGALDFNNNGTLYNGYEVAHHWTAYGLVSHELIADPQWLEQHPEANVDNEEGHHKPVETAVFTLIDSTVISQTNLVRVNAGSLRGNGHIQARVINFGGDIYIESAFNNNSVVLRLTKYTEHCGTKRERGLHFNLYGGSVFDKLLVDESVTLLGGVHLNVDTEQYSFGPQLNETFQLIDTPQVVFCGTYDRDFKFIEVNSRFSNQKKIRKAQPFALVAPIPLQYNLPSDQFFFNYTGTLPNLSVKVNKVSCPSNCHNRGICDNYNQVCYCMDGYGGDDCRSIGFTVDRLVTTLVTGGFIVFVLLFSWWTWRRTKLVDLSLIFGLVISALLVIVLLLLLIGQILVLTRAIGDTSIVFYISDFVALLSAFVGLYLCTV